MKPTLTFLLLLAAVARGDGLDLGKLQEICNRDRFAKTCLAGMLTFRCRQYHTELHALGTCVDTSRDAADLLDLRPTSKEDHALAVAFGTDLVHLMKDPFTQKYLSATRDAVSEAMRHHAPFNLWTHTLSYLKGDASKALWFLGVLLQDTSSAMEHVEYLRANKPAGVSESAVDTLSELMDLLEPEHLQEEKFREWMKLYPAMVPVGEEAKFNANVYHFYTLGYLSLRLKWRNANKKMAAFLPFWIEASYKFRRIDPSRWPLDPKPFDSKEHELALRDIYTAYLATRWAAGVAAPKVGFKEFADKLAADPNGYLKELYLTFR